PTDISERVKRLFGDPQPYKIGPSDVLQIVVYDHPELLPLGGQVISQSSDPTGVSTAPGFIVSADGLITYPFIGRIKVAGLSEIEASELITSRLSKFIKDPQVNVRINAFRSQRAYVDGEV